jgi:hypothetical protein
MTGKKNVRTNTTQTRDLVLSICGLKESFVEETQYIQTGVRYVLKLKKVGMSNIMCLYLTLIVE